MVVIGGRFPHFFHPQVQAQNLAAQLAQQGISSPMLAPPVDSFVRGVAGMGAFQMPTPASRYEELRGALAQHYAAGPGVNGPYGIPPPSSYITGLSNVAQQMGTNDSASILSDPSLTVEDKVMLLLMTIMKSMDKEIEGQTHRIEGLQKQQNTGGANAAGASIDVETTKLTRLTTKRAQMFDTLRSIMDKYNQTAKGVIDSMSR